MQKISRKFKSAYYLMANSPKPIETIARQVNKNIRQYIVNFRNGKPFIYKRYGFEFICIPESKTSVNLYISHQCFDEIELLIARDWLSEGDTCIDLGANMGYFSAFFAKNVCTKGKVIAVEASRQTSEYVQKAIDLLSLKQIYLEQVCVTDQNGLVEFMVSRDGHVDVKQSLKVNPSEADFFKKEIIQSTTLNQLINNHKTLHNVSLVKIDVEGAEPLVLRKGNLLFHEESLPLFIVEIYKVGLSRLGFAPKDVWNFFKPHLFDLYYVNRSYPNPMPELSYGVLYKLLNPEDHNWPWLSNLVAIPKVGKYSNRRKNIAKYLL